MSPPICKRLDGQQRKPTEIRRREIVDAAIRIIALEGPRRFTSKNIASEVGITSGAIFRHFATMEAVVDAAVERMGAVLSADFPAGALDPIERLKAFFLRRTKTIRDHPHISRLLLSDHLEQAAGSQAAERTEQFKKQSRAFVTKCLRDAERAGDLAHGVSADVGAVFVIGAILALSHASTRVVNTSKVKRLSEDVWSGIERMLKAAKLPEETVNEKTRPQRHR